MIKDAIELAQMSLVAKSSTKQKIEGDIRKIEEMFRTIGMTNAEEVIESIREGAVNICLLVDRPYSEVGAVVYFYLMDKARQSVLIGMSKQNDKDQL